MEHYFNQVWMMTAAMGAVTYLGYQLRSLPPTLWQQLRKRLLYRVTVDQGTELFSYIEVWIRDYHGDSIRNAVAALNTPNVNDVPLSSSSSVRTPAPQESIVYRHSQDTFVLNWGRKKILVTKGREKMDNAQDLRNAFRDSFVFEGWNAKACIQDLLNQVLEYNQRFKTSTQAVYFNDKFGGWQRYGQIRGKSLDNVVLKNKDAVVEDLTDFVAKENWYLKRGLVYKRGYLFYGEPGNGKTSLALALAKYLNRNIQFLNLSDLESDSNLLQAFTGIQDYSVLVLEDVDRNKQKVSLSTLLNCIDGAFSRYGIVVIMTTNNIDDIDPALIREGRVDMRVHIGNPDVEIVNQYLSLFYDHDVRLPEDVVPRLSMSGIQEICLRHKDDSGHALRTLASKLGLCDQIRKRENGKADKYEDLDYKTI